MSIEKLKTNLLALEIETDEEENLMDAPTARLEVLCDSVRQALAIASKELQSPVGKLDYEVIQKGSSGILGVGKMPYRVLVNLAEDSHSNQNEGADFSLEKTRRKSKQKIPKIELNRDGKALVRIYKTGVYLTIKPHMGTGIPIDIYTTKDKILRAGVLEYKEEVVVEAVKNRKGEPTKIAEWIPHPDADATVSVEVVPNEMFAYINISAPRHGGRHLTAEEILQALKHFGVVFGYEMGLIEMALENEKYGQQILAAKGSYPKDGEDGDIDYKVKIDKQAEYKEDSQGRVDFLSKGIIENVVQGQLLAKLIPPKEGVPGRSTTGKIIPAKNGKKKELKQGNGTILSKDGTSLTAEKNGQVVYSAGRISIEEVFTVSGDVGLSSGNVIFLGSVVVHGLVSDNMEVKAGGNIEIGGSVQKAQVEAEGDVIIRGGVQGRDKAQIESTTGSVFAKFVQNTRIVAEKNVIISEAIMHSNIQAVGKVICNGRRAQIVGGEILAGSEVRVKQLGAQASTPTRIVVGMNPKILNQQRDIENLQEDSTNELNKAKQNIRTLTRQKMALGGKLSKEKEEMLVHMLDAQESLEAQLKELKEEKKELDEYISELVSGGSVHVEKTLYPGVSVEINGALFLAKDEYNRVSLIERGGNIKIIPFKSETEKSWRKRSIS